MATALRKPLIDIDPVRRGLDLNALTHEEHWLNTAPLYKLVLEHDDLCRNLNLPHAELWEEKFAANNRRIRLVWATIKRRFPEYALKRGGRSCTP